MHFITFPVASTNIFPLTNSKHGGQLATEYNLKSREMVATNPAIKYAQGQSFIHSLDDFKIKATTKGAESMGEALIKLRYNGKLYSGNGVSTDINGASIRAYIQAVNKIIYDEENN